MPTLIIRADASSDIGTGHVMRCLALAQAWQDANGHVVFAMVSPDAGIRQRLVEEGMDVVHVDASAGSKLDAEIMRGLALSKHAVWMAVDGYHFSSEYRQQLQIDSCRLLTVDDHGESYPYDCDLLLNVNIYAEPLMYESKTNHTPLLLGPNYALLRREFLNPDGKLRTPETAQKILVTFGGGDPHNVSLEVLNALARLSDTKLEVVVIAGAANPHLTTLHARAAQLPFSVQVLSNVSNMPEWMDWADLGVSAGGGTCFEFAIRRMPMLLITMAKNHERTVEAFQEAGVAVSLGWFHSLDADRFANSLKNLIHNSAVRSKMVEQAAKLVDGSGAKRVVNEMLKISDLRHAELQTQS